MSAQGARRLDLGRMAIDSAAIGSLMLLALASIEPAWGSLGVFVPVAGGIVAGLAIAWFGAWRRWGVLPLAALTIVVFIVIAGPLALPDSTIGGIVPTPATLFAAALGVVTSWKQYLTATIPVSAFSGMGLVPLILALLGSVLGGSLALRVRPASWALLPVGAAGIAAIAFGAPEAAWPLAQASAALVIAIGWLAYRSVHDARTADVAAAAPASARWRRLALGGGLLALAAMITAGAALASPPTTQREVLREHIVPPLDLRNYHSPLSAFRKYNKDWEKTTLFHVKGLPAGERLTLATMDSFDGLVYNVAGSVASTASGSFAHVGEVLRAEPAPRPVTLDVRVMSDAGVWVVGGGQPSRVSFAGPRGTEILDSLYFNAADGQLLTTAGLQAGDSYRVTTAFSPMPTPSQLQGVRFVTSDLPNNRDVPDSVDAQANKLVGDASDPIDQVVNLTQGLSKGGFFSHGLEGEAPSLPGHGAARIDSLLTGEQMIGDDEQYAAAAALMARRLGMPARVVMGFYPADDADVSAGWDVKGADAHAWIEVRFAGKGWVRFDPTPPPEQVPQTEVPKTKNEPKPQVLQPPPPPEEPAEVPPETVQDAPPNQRDAPTAGIWMQVALVAGSVIGGLALLTIPFWVIAAAKALRRRKRRGAKDPAVRVAGGFQELCDRATDFGADLPERDTRLRLGAHIAAACPQTQAVALAARADRVTFGPREPQAAEASEFWRDVERSVGALGQERGWVAKLRARASLASLRRGRRLRKDAR